MQYSSKVPDVSWYTFTFAVFSHTNALLLIVGHWERRLLLVRTFCSSQAIMIMEIIMTEENRNTLKKD